MLKRYVNNDIASVVLWVLIFITLTSFIGFAMTGNHILSIVAVVSTVIIFVWGVYNILLLLTELGR